MVKITNGIEIFEVTRGAYDGIYSLQGYEIVDESKKPYEEPTTEEEVKDEFAELLLKPISQWSKEEVKDFAAAKNIDISGTKNANEAKEIIKSFLDELQ